MSKIHSAPFGGYESPKSVLLECAHGDDIEGFCLMVKHSTGEYTRTCIGMPPAEQAFSGLILQQEAYKAIE